MDFIIWHLLAIVSVMAISFIAGYRYASNTRLSHKWYWHNRK